MPIALFWIAIIFFTLLPRTWVLWNIQPIDTAIYSDMINYTRVAHHILTDTRNPTDLLFQHGYSWLLVLSQYISGRFTGIIYVHLACALLTAWLVWKATSRWLGKKIGYASLVISCSHIPWISLQAFYLSETIFTLVIALIFYLLVFYPPHMWKNIFWIGLVAACANFFKGTNQFFILLMPSWLVLKRKFHPHWKKSTLLFATPILVVTLLTGLYYQTYYGKWQTNPTLGAINLVEGKCGAAKIEDNMGWTFKSPLFVQRETPGTKRIEAPFYEAGPFWQEGILCILTNPAVLWASLKYPLFLFTGNLIWPSNQGRIGNLERHYSVYYALFMLPALIIGFLWICFKFKGRKWLPILLPLTLFITVYVFKSEMRYRVPYDVVFIPLTVVGYQKLFRIFVPRKSHFFYRDLYLSLAVLLPFIYFQILVLLS